MIILVMWDEAAYLFFYIKRILLHKSSWYIYVIMYILWKWVKCVSVHNLALCAYSLLLLCRFFLGVCGHGFMMVV